jgi:hypothetical protein
MGTAANTAPANPSVGQKLLAAELALELAPLNSFFTALQQPNVNKESVVEDFLKLQLATLENAPGGEAVGINVLAAYAQQKLNTLVQKVAGVTPTAAAPAAGS